MQFPVASRQLFKQLLIDYELTRGIAADIDLLGKLNIGPRKAFRV
jgi:hypothetical protein